MSCTMTSKRMNFRACNLRGAFREAIAVSIRQEGTLDVVMGKSDRGFGLGLCYIRREGFRMATLILPSHGAQVQNLDW